MRLPLAHKSRAMKHLLLCALLVLAGTGAGAQAQRTLSGKVTDPALEPVPGAYVMLFKDTVLQKTTLTDADGHYNFESLPDGPYMLKASAMGFDNYSSPVLTSATAPPDIVLTEKKSTLKEVTVQAQKPFLEVKADRVVVNVENSIVSSGSSVMDVLQHSPGVTVDNNDNISLKGKQGVVIWIDGKPTPMQGADLGTVLRGMPSGSVDKIELISNPGARYDAAGSAGIINIKTKKDQRMGINGTATINYGQGKFPKYGAGLTLNYRNKKLNVYFNYNYALRYWFNHLTLDRKFLDTAMSNDGGQLFRYEQDNYAVFDFNNHTASTGIDYSLSDATTLGAVFSFGSNVFSPKADNASRALDGGNHLLYDFKTTGRHANKYYNYAVNLNLRHNFDSSGRSLSIDADYAAFNTDNRQNFVTRYTAPDGSAYQPDYYLKSKLSGITRIQSLKADYIHPLGHALRLEAGVKSSFAQADNEPLFYEMVGNDYVLDTKRSNHFLYKENINAGYINLSKDAGKWSGQLGLRLENTNANWHQVTTGQKYDTSYTQLFPSLALQYHLDAKQDLGITFSRRIERPNYQQLNPFKYFIDKTTYRAGYPYLQPASFYSVELSHTFNQKLVTTFTYGINKGVITEVIQPSDTEDSVTVQTTKNLKQMTFVGISGAYTFQFTRWWSNVSNINMYYSLYEGNIANTPLRNGKPTFDLNTNNTFLLPGNISIELELYYQARQVYGYMDVQPLWMLNAGIQKHFLDRKATLKFNIQDIFFTGYPKATSIYTGYREDFIAQRETRVANMSLIYRFGKNTVAPARKRGGGAEDEKSRAAGSNL